MNSALNLICFAALLPVCSPACAAAPKPPGGRTPALTVLALDYAGLRGDAARELQSLTTELMSRTGIRVEWVWCNAGRRDTRSVLCGARLTPDIVVIRILARYPGGYRRLTEPLGYAVIEEGYVSLYASEIRQVAVHWDLSFGCLLGYAAVHEIGHLLLGREHSRSGVMRAVWRRSECSRMSQSRLTFSESEGEAMRRSVPANTTYRGAVTPATPGPESFSQGVQRR
jgi:hypothetical protein